MARLSIEAKQSITNIPGADFILVELMEGEAFPVYDHAGEILKFTTGALASAHADRLTRELGRKVQPRRVNNGDWRAREAERFKDATYRPLPWTTAKWWLELADIHKDHYPHVSVQKQALVAFTESDEKGAADIQTTVKPGKYLERFFNDKISDYMVRDLSTIFAAKFEVNEVLFAETADEIEEVYLTGPSSCMSKAKESYPTKGYHPVRAYAAGDLSVAYITREGQIKARVVVWPAKKTYSPSIYGDAGRLEPMLRKLGFTKSTPIGARLAAQRIPAKGNQHTFAVPHVDGAPAVRVEKDHLIITDENSNNPRVLVFGGGTGITEACGMKCEKCGEGDYRTRDMTTVVTGVDKTDPWCKGCHKAHTVQCCESGSTIARDNAIELGYPKGGFIWSRYKSRIKTCAATGLVSHQHNMAHMGGTTYWVIDHYKKHGTRCGSCGGFRPKDKGVKCGHCGTVS